MFKHFTKKTRRSKLVKIQKNTWKTFINFYFMAHFPCSSHEMQYGCHNSITKIHRHTFLWNKLQIHSRHSPVYCECVQNVITAMSFCKPASSRPILEWDKISGEAYFLFILTHTEYGIRFCWRSEHCVLCRLAPNIERVQSNLIVEILSVWFNSFDDSVCIPPEWQFSQHTSVFTSYSYIRSKYLFSFRNSENELWL